MNTPLVIYLVLTVVGSFIAIEKSLKFFDQYKGPKSEAAAGVLGTVLGLVITQWLLYAAGLWTLW